MSVQAIYDPEDRRESPPWQTIEQIGQDPTLRSGLPVVSSGFGALDVILHGGFRSQSVYILGGRTGAAKSTLAANVARIAAEHGHPVLFFKLEEPPVELVWRLQAAHSGISLRAFQDGLVNMKDMKVRARMLNCEAAVKRWPIYIASSRILSTICQTIERHWACEFANCLVIVDQLSMIHVPDCTSVYQTVTVASNALRKAAIDASVPILVVAQVNRGASKAKERLSMNDLRDSGAIENDAASVLMINRSREMPSHHKKRIMDVIVAKNRHGRATADGDDPVQLVWTPESARVDGMFVEGQT